MPMSIFTLISLHADYVLRKLRFFDIPSTVRFSKNEKSVFVHNALLKEVANGTVAILLGEDGFLSYHLTSKDVMTQ